MSLKHNIKEWMLKAGSLIYANDDSKVIYYHDIHAGDPYTQMSTDIELFEMHLDILQREGYKVVPEIRASQKEVEITFDDGFQGIYDNFSLFHDRQIPVRVFLISSFIGKKNYMSKEAVSDLLKTGLFHIGSHTVSHENLDIKTEKEIAYELQRSKEVLENLFATEVETLCYPRGRFTDRVVEMAKNTGYKKQYTCLPGAYFGHFKEGLINRSLVQHASKNEFLYILNGADRMFYKRYLRQHYHPGEAK